MFFAQLSLPLQSYTINIIMGLFKKILYGGLGWTLGGPIGAIIGVYLASLSDRQNSYNEQHQHRPFINTNSPNNAQRASHAANDFQVAMLVLMASVIKADGKIVKSELNSVKRVLLANFGEQGTLEALQLLKKMLDQEIDPVPVARQCAANLTYSSRLQLLHILYDLAAVDGELCTSETKVIDTIAYNMMISEQDTASIRAMFMVQSNSNWAYDVLEIPSTATDDEVKKAYRKMAMKYHPDKVSSLGEEAKQTATEKFRKVKDAYDAIKKQRNMA